MNASSAGQVPTRRRAWWHDVSGRISSRHRFWLFVAVMAALSVWLRTGFPVHVIGGASDDDRLFVELAKQLVVGHWLGPFSNLTLVKGIGYPAFLAACFLIGIPAKIGESLLCLSAGTGAALLVARSSRSYLCGGILFACLALNPILWTDDLARVIREGIYGSLTLAVVVLATWLAFPRHASLRFAWIGCVGAGVAAAWFWLTREEGVWLVPSVLLLVISGGMASFGKRMGGGAALGRAFLARLGIAFTAMLAVTSTVAASNRINYGAYELVEVKAAPFEHAYGALYRIRPTRWRRYVVFPADVRAKLYIVSPAARELRPFFEGKSGEMWRTISCQNAPPGSDCSEILAGWFQWALRDAVATAGHYSSADVAAAYYDRLATEIDAACDRHALDCLPARHTLAPPFRIGYLFDAVARLPSLAAVIWHETIRPAAPSFSVVMQPEDAPDMRQITPVADFVGNSQPTAVEATTIRKASRMRSMAIYKVVTLISRFYAVGLAAMIALSLLGGVGLMARKEWSRKPALLAFFLACYLGVAARALLLTYLDATAIPSINILYWSPASPLLISAAVIGTWAGLPRLFRMRRNAQ